MVCFIQYLIVMVTSESSALFPGLALAGRRVLLALESAGDSMGGPGSWATRIVPWLRAEGVDARVAVLHHGDSDENAGVVKVLRDSGVPTAVHCTVDIRTDTRWFIEQLAEFPPGLFIANNVPSAMYAALNARPFGVRSAMVVHSDDPYYYKLIDAFVLGAQPSAVDLVVTVSAFLEEKLQGPLAGRVALQRIPCGAPRSETAVDWASGELHLVYVGRFSRFQKRVDDVAKALCAACDQIPGVRASMVGDGADRGIVEEILRATPGGEKVTLVGSLPPSEVPTFLHSGHVMVLLSDFEGIPIALMEGMAIGLVPVVSPIRSGIPELVFDGETGFIVEDRDAAFVSAIRRIREDPILWQRLSTAARRQFEQGFSPEVVLEAWSRNIGASPAPFTPPETLDLPIHSWLDFWVDGSMAKGFGGFRLSLQRMVWSAWAGLSPGLRERLRQFVKSVLSHDGFKLRTYRNHVL